jgi:acylphosphatase
VSTAGGFVKRLKDYYSVKAASKATGIKYKALLQRIARGKVEAMEFNSIKLIPATEVERLKKERTSC